jgi:RND family efflux transporter MFP subunit
LVVLGIVALFFLGLFVGGILPRLSRAKTLDAASTNVKHGPVEVTVISVRNAPSETDITLPGNVQGLTEAVIYARADGYISKRYVDIGQRVSAGQLLVDIESPEIQQQVMQGRAALEQAQSNLNLSGATLQQNKANLQLAEETDRRTSALVSRGVLSKQEGDQSRSTLLARQADVAAAEAAVQTSEHAIRAANANLKRLQELQGYTHVRAPFSGVITARNVDIGTLVSAGSGSSVRELFRMAQSERLRIFVNVPQSEVRSIRVGLPCTLTVRQFGAREFPATVVRTAEALDPASRTLLTEVQLPNAKGELLPGMYAQVKFHIRREHPPLLIPSEALITDAKGEQVALVRGDRIHLQPVVSGNDYGPEVEILSGIAEGDRLVTNLTDEVQEGRTIKPVETKQ